MRRRLCVVATVVAAGSFSVGAGIALAAGSTTAAKPITLRCHLSLATAPPSGSASVDQPPSNGSQYGPVRCPAASFGRGIAGDSFKVPDSGDMVGTYTQYFGAGSVHGKFDLSPQENTFVPSANFLSQSWAGTVTVTGGTGVYTGIKELAGKKGIGTLTCTSPDSVHLTCTEKVKLAAI